jgi:hypothetical protein
MMMDENKQRKSKGGDMQSSSVGRRGRKEPHQSKKRVHWGDKNQSNKKPKIVGCFNCGSKDHMAKDCPNPAKGTFRRNALGIRSLDFLTPLEME